MSAITVLTGSSQLSSLLRAKKDRLVVIDFHATWCGPCKAIAPVYERLSNTYRGVTFCKVDVDAAQDIAKEYRVSAMPTFVFIKGGNKVDEVKGANAAALEAAIKKHSGGAASSGSAFPGSGHSLSGEKVAAAPAGPSSLPNLRLIALVVAVFGLWYYYGSNVDMDVPESGGGFY